MRIHLATDHAGLDFSRHLVDHLAAQGHDVVDHGPTDYDALDDYPAFIIRAAEAVVADQSTGTEALGVVFGGSGNGEQIAANKVAGIRAALAWNESTAQLARQHNDANVISIGARQHTLDEATALIDAFIAEPFSFDLRHERRIAQLAEYESTGAI
ncbi:MAG: ribose-5-phosphate isomerase, partial [Naasia sp.]